MAIPASRIQPLTSSCARRIAGVAKGRVIVPGSSVHAASSSHRRMTVSARLTSAERREADLLRPAPQHDLAEVLQPVVAVVDRREMVARELPHLAGEERGAVREKDLRLAEAAGVEEKLPGRGMARVVLVAEAEVELAERD